MHEQKKDIEFIKELINANNNYNETAHKEMISKIDKFIDTAEGRFAGRWTEKVLIWGGIAVGGAVIVAVMEVILK